VVNLRTAPLSDNEEQVVEVSYLFRVPAAFCSFLSLVRFFQLIKKCVYKNSYGIMGVTRMVVLPVAAPRRNRHKFNVRTVLQYMLNHPRSHLKRALSYCSGIHLRIGASCLSIFKGLRREGSR